MASPQKENGHIRIANELVEAFAMTQLSGYEIRIIWVVLRKTWGWGKKEDWISFSQFRELTGLLDPHISRTLKRLVSRNILTKNGNCYGLQKDYQNWYGELPKMVSQVTKNGKSPRVKELPKMVDTKESKNTITKDTIQKKGTSPAEITRNFIDSVLSKNDNYYLLVQGVSQKYKIPPEVVRREVDSFTRYWTELNKSGTKQKWELEKTFEVTKRLQTWFNNISKYNRSFKNEERVGKSYDN